MGTWGPGVYENDAALDFIAEWTEEAVSGLTQRVEEILADDARSRLDEDGEGMLVPCVDILTKLVETCQAMPPDIRRIQEWKTIYLAIFETQIDELDPDGGYVAERRQVIEATFDRLLNLAERA